MVKLEKIGAKEFYHLEIGQVNLFFSYETLIAAEHEGRNEAFVSSETYGRTTAGHINLAKRPMLNGAEEVDPGTLAQKVRSYIKSVPAKKL